MLNLYSAKDKQISEFINSKMSASCEVPADDYFSLEKCLEDCIEHFGYEKMNSYGLESTPHAIIALGVAIRYLKNVQKNRI